MDIAFERTAFLRKNMMKKQRANGTLFLFIGVGIKPLPLLPRYVIRERKQA